MTLRPIDWMLISLCLGLLACIALLAWRRRSADLEALFEQPPFTPDAVAQERARERALNAFLADDWSRP